MSTQKFPIDIETLFRRCIATPAPMLVDTKKQLTALCSQDEALNAQAVHAVLATDALAILRLYTAYSEKRSQSARSVDAVPTLEGMLFMMGVAKFRSLVAGAQTVDAFLPSDDHQRIAVLRGLNAVLRRARMGAYFAKSWAVRRRDLGYEEIAMAAMLHDSAEMYLWLLEPKLAMLIAALKHRKPGLRSAAAQEIVLGFHLSDLQIRLNRHWRLPDWMCHLDSLSEEPRVRNVLLAVNWARHVATGWDDAALPDDQDALGELLALEPGRVRTMVQAEFEAYLDETSTGQAASASTSLHERA